MHPASLSNRTTKVFLVEDNEDTRFLLAYLLEQAGFAVRSAGSMEEALREFSHSDNEMLISDVGLPDGDGCELLRQLRSRGPCPFAIAMSGFGTVRDIAASRAAGFSHHLVKPVEVQEVERLLLEAASRLHAAG